MKKFLSIILTVALALSTITAFASDSDGVSVKFNNETMVFDVNPIIENGRTLVPFRAIFEALGCSVFYMENDGVQTVKAKKADDTLVLTIGESAMTYNDAEIALDVAPKIINGRTLVPLRAVSETFDADVDWDNDTRTALVSSMKGDYKISSKTFSKDLVAPDGKVIMNLVATYPVVDNPENDEFITLINDMNLEFASGFLFADEELEGNALALYEKNDASLFPMELSTTFTIDTNKNGFLSITHHTCTSMIEKVKNNKESIVWDMKNKKQLDLPDIIIGEDEENIKQTVYDAFVAYYEENFADVFDAKTAEKLGSELGNVRFYLTDNSLMLYFNPGQVIDGVDVQKTVIPYSEAFFKIKLEEEEKVNVISPLPSAINKDTIDNCTVAVSLEKGDAYVDDSGKMQMKIKVYDYDLYDMVDIANLKAGDIFILSGKEVKIESVERTEGGLVVINGGQENGGFDLYSNDSTVYYEAGFNDVKSYYEVGEYTIPVSTEFIYTDSSDLDKDPVLYYPGDFLTDDAGIEYNFSENNTSVVIKDGYIVEMTKHYTP